MIKPLHSRLSRLGVPFPFLVAPMVGLSHVAFRAMVRSYVPAGLDVLIFTEMLSTRRLPSERLECTNELKCADNEAFFVPQLLGNEERFIAPSVKKLMQLKPWGFDINMGCPVSHILKHNWGVRLMGDKNYAADVVRMTKRHASVPVSVKLRGGLGTETDLDYLLNLTEALESAGADWITVHARLSSQGHDGAANWGLVSEVRKRRSIPIVANGDIQTAADALRLIDEYQVDGAMIARAATARPWILWQIADALGHDQAPPGREGEKAPISREDEGREYLRACLTMIDFLRHYFTGDEYIRKKFSFFVATGAKWFPFGHAFWRLTMKAKSVEQLRELVAEFGAKHEFQIYERATNF